ncbi:MAG TPA: succinate dehydrogenase, cytochrome b556 subunit [Rhizomicrobium sp.]|jgi:succinate dehydrogenase / fumarate reductase cytochrome b subunit|nr:succinate dehydrogenase, cytochrome b556 subunit [Rhizomicrobium sp.]
MAETPHPARRPRPLSPFVTIYHWPVTMATSIVHRITGCGLAAGTVLLGWWLIATASGPEAFNRFTDLAATPLGQVILFGVTWSLAFHLLNGIRHLAWDLGYGFSKAAAQMNSIIVIAASILVAAGVFAAAYLGHGGYYQ